MPRPLNQARVHPAQLPRTLSSLLCRTSLSTKNGTLECPISSYRVGNYILSTTFHAYSITYTYLRIVSLLFMNAIQCRRIEGSQGGTIPSA